ASLAVGALGLDSRQTTQELRAMFTGEQGPDNTLNRVLGITKAELDRAKTSGEGVAEMLLRKLKPFTDVSAVSMANFSTVASNVGDILQQVAGQASKPIFQEIKRQLIDVQGTIDGARGKLGEMGLIGADLVRKYAPLIESFLRLALVVTDAGLKFLQAMEPVIPIVKEVVDIVALLVDTLGPLGPGIYVAFKAFQALSGAKVIITGITAAIELMTTSALASAITLLGIYAVAVGVVVAAIYAMKLALVDLRSENAKVTDSYKTLQTTTVSALDGIEKKYPMLAVQSRKLRLEMIGMDPEDQKGIERVNAEYLKLSHGLNTVKKATDEIRSTPKPHVLTPEEIEKARKAVEKFAAEVEKARKWTVKWAEDSDKAWAGYTSTLDKFNKDAATTATERIRAELQQHLDEIQHQYEKVEIWRLTLDQLVILNAAKDAAIAQTNKETNAKLTAEWAKSQSFYRGTIALMPVDFAAAQDIIRDTASKTGQDIRDVAARYARDWYDNARTAADGVAVAHARMVASAKTAGQETADYLTSLNQSITQGAQTGLFDILSGKWSELGGVIHGVLDSVNASWSKMATSLVSGLANGTNKLSDLGTIGAPGQGTGLFAPAFGSSNLGLGASFAAGGFQGYQMGGSIGNGGEANQMLGAVFGAVGSLWGPIGTLIGSLV
ncbi:MAG: hypothetical protein ABIP42_17095, partial [Planctomycetota bacterium]